MIVCPPASIGGTELDVALPAITLEAGARLPTPTLRAWFWGSDREHAQLVAGERLEPRPTVLFIHGLTQGARAAGPAGFWEPLFGSGRPFRPWAHRLVSFNLLGSCRGSTGPASPDFPTREDDAAFPAPPALVRGGRPPRSERELPATITTRDQARAILLALDRIGIGEIELVCGGSIGGMVAAWLCLLAPERFHRALVIATPLASTASMIGWNHVAREAILSDPRYPDARDGLRVARQIARMTYRSETGLSALQGRRTAGAFDEAKGARDDAWSSRTPYRMETYLRHAADSFDFDARAYIAMSSAMDHHDLTRSPDGALRTRARALIVHIAGDRLVDPSAVDALRANLAERGASVHAAELGTNRGHDALFSEWGELTRLAQVAMRL